MGKDNKVRPIRSASKNTVQENNLWEYKKDEKL